MTVPGFWLTGLEPLDPVRSRYLGKTVSMTLSSCRDPIRDAVAMQ